MDYRESEHVKKANQLFREGYNCSQAIFLAFNDLCDLEFNEAAKISSSFGGGMARLREVCGAVTGMFMVIGSLYGYDDAKASTEKKELYEKVQLMAHKFQEENGSIVCRELFIAGKDDTKPVATKRDGSFYKKRPCPELVEYAACILEEFIQENPPIK